MAHSLKIKGYDYVEFYVGSAKMTAYWYTKALGMDISGYMGPGTGVRDRVSFYLTQNDIKFVITSALKPSNFEVNSFVTAHGDGVKRWAVRVKDVREAFEIAVQNGAIPITLPRKLEDEDGILEEAGIRVFDDNELVFIDYSEYSGVFKPGYKPYTGRYEVRLDKPNLAKIDHISVGARTNETNKWAQYFIETLGFEPMFQFGPEDLSTPYSARLSWVVRTPDGSIKHVIDEPYRGLKPSPVEEYLNECLGAGVQHIALSCDDIVSSVQTLTENGVEFIEVPGAYYDELEKRNAELGPDEKIAEDILQLRQLSIMCTNEHPGYLLQAVTRPIGDRPAFSLQILQRRKGAEGFGRGNFQALFEAVEIEKERLEEQG